MIYLEVGLYISSNTQKNNIHLKNYNHLKRMADRIHYLIDEINDLSDDRIQPTKNQSSDEEQYRANNRNILIRDEVEHGEVQRKIT